MSTQIVENGVLIKGSFPIGAFGTDGQTSGLGAMFNAASWTEKLCGVAYR